MQPASTLLMILGYALSLPILFRVLDVVHRQQRVRLTGHQIGMSLALLGWLFKGSVAAAALHLAWMIGLRLWFQIESRRARSVSAV